MDIVSENLTFTYSVETKKLAFKALDGVSVTVPEGEFFGIVGKTGSGKTTFVQHLNGLLRVKEGNGKLFVGDFDLSDKKCDMRSLRAKVGMMFQYPEQQLFAETVEEDVAFALKNFAPDLLQDEVKKRVAEALSLTGLNYEAVKDKSPFDLSGGQKRRVAIAGVLVAKPEILVLDEPAAGLDPKGKREFLSLLVNLRKTFVKTVIIVSHDMNLVAEYCTSAAVFNGGKIVLTGSPKEIFSDEQKVFSCGLDLPLTAALTRTLREKGLNVLNDYTMDGFVEGFIAAVQGGKR